MYEFQLKEYTQEEYESDIADEDLQKEPEKPTLFLRRLNVCLKSLILFLYKIPIDKFPIGFHIFWSCILLVKIVCMFPNIANHNRN